MTIFSPQIIIPRFKRPTAVGGLSFDFTTGSLPGGCTLTRASSGTYYNSSGVLSTAAVDTARFDYNPASLAIRGILIEPAATNICLRSEAYDDAAWNLGARATVTANATTAPDGNATADKVVDTATSGSHGRQQNVTVSTSTQYSLSHYSKAAERTYTYCQIQDTSATERGNYINVSTGAVGSSVGTPAATVDAINNGWYRVLFTWTTPGAGTTVGIYGFMATSDGGVSYLGDGTSGNYWWGSQLEAGAKATSYIPTTSSSASRSADALSFTIPGGVTTLTYTFDDSSTQNVGVSSGSYTVPTNLNRAWIKTIVGS